jgi:hypothetical protein
MAAEHLDISDAFTWEEDLPRPQWDLIRTWVQTHVQPKDQADAWTDIAHQWLAKLGEALGTGYQLTESASFLQLAPSPEPSPQLLLRTAEACRHVLLAGLPGVAAFQMPGKQVIISLARPEAYYTYLSVYYPEGRHGGSSGTCIRSGFPHIAMYGSNLLRLESTLAHEMTHASLNHLTLPQWVEEGLAQIFQQEITERRFVTIDGEGAREHRRFWAKHGLNLFWFGDGFHRPDNGQRLSYQLAEILTTVLFLDYRPRWLGLNKEPRRRLLAFLREADASDCGQAASREHLYLGLGELAARFLGPGEWDPSL